MKDAFSKLCSPAKLYFAILLVNILLMLFYRVKFGFIFSKLLFGGIWTYILSWLCQKGYKSLSWFLVLLPFFLIALVVIFGTTVIGMNNNADVVIVSSGPSKCGQAN
jgi:hypothetical protein